jgi:hypothetical protein
VSSLAVNGRLLAVTDKETARPIIKEPCGGGLNLVKAIICEST